MNFSSDNDCQSTPVSASTCCVAKESASIAIAGAQSDRRHRESRQSLSDRPRYRAVEARGDESTGLGDQLTAPHALPGSDNGPSRNAYVLAERHDVVLAERHSLNRQILCLLLVMSRMNPVLKVAAQSTKSSHRNQSRFCAANCSRRLRILLAISACVFSLISRISASEAFFCASRSAWCSAATSARISCSSRSVNGVTMPASSCRVCQFARHSPAATASVSDTAWRCSSSSLSRCYVRGLSLAALRIQLQPLVQGDRCRSVVRQGSRSWTQSALVPPPNQQASGQAPHLPGCRPGKCATRTRRRRWGRSGTMAARGC